MKNLFAFAACVILIAGCSGDVPPPQNIKDISSRISSVTEINLDGKNVIKIDLSASAAWDSNSYFRMASNDMKNISDGVVKHFHQNKADYLFFVVWANLSDKYGNSRDDRVLAVPFDMKELSKVNYGGVTNWDVLNLADDVVYYSEAGKSMVREWCVDGDNAKYAKTFCRNNT